MKKLCSDPDTIYTILGNYWGTAIAAVKPFVGGPYQFDRMFSCSHLVRSGFKQAAGVCRNKAVLRVTLAILFCSTGRCSSAAPTISFVWPPQDTVLGEPLYVRIPVSAQPSSTGSITQVQFFAQQSNLIGVSTNSPFTLFWNLGAGVTNQDNNPLVLNAVATDSLGLSATSAPLKIYLILGPPPPVLKITSPQDGAVFPTPANILMTAELLASVGDTGPEEFLVGTNSVATVNTNGRNEAFNIDTPPVSTIVSNLTEGRYKLAVRYLGWDGPYCLCDSVNITVAKLAVTSPRVSLGRFEFDVVTSFNLVQNVTEVSTNLMDWIPVGTNQSSDNTFTFTDSSPVSGARRFYRVLVRSN